MIDGECCIQIIYPGKLPLPHFHHSKYLVAQAIINVRYPFLQIVIVTSFYMISLKQSHCSIMCKEPAYFCSKTWDIPLFSSYKKWFPTICSSPLLVINNQSLILYGEIAAKCFILNHIVAMTKSYILTYIVSFLWT